MAAGEREDKELKTKPKRKITTFRVASAVPLRGVARSLVSSSKRLIVKYSWIGHGLQSGPTLACSLWLSDLKNQEQLWISRQKNQGSFFNFFGQSKNELVRPKTVFLAVLAKI